jgi:hypothetical protein
MDADYERSSARPGPGSMSSAGSRTSRSRLSFNEAELREHARGFARERFQSQLSEALLTAFDKGGHHALPALSTAGTPG